MPSDSIADRVTGAATRPNTHVTGIQVLHAGWLTRPALPPAGDALVHHVVPDADGPWRVHLNINRFKGEGVPSHHFHQELIADSSHGRRLKWRWHRQHSAAVFVGWSR